MVGDDGDEECAHYLRIYVGCMHWAFGLLTGVIPYPVTMRTEDDYLERFTEEEILFNLLMVAFGALAWTYITAKILDIVFNADPDLTAFKNRMDDLNRFISFHTLGPNLAQQLREYFYETRIKRAADTRQEICAEMSASLKQQTLDLVHNEWLKHVAFFRGMAMRDGTEKVPPVSQAFRAQLSTEMQSAVFSPMETPPAGRLYVIAKGSARFKAQVRQAGFSWGALDVLLPNAPLTKRAVAITYLHVLWVDGGTLRNIARDFPEDGRSMRLWALWHGTKEFLLDNLGKASDEERAVAKEWVREKNKEQHNNKAQNGKAQASKEQNAVPSKEKQESSTSSVAANIAKESAKLSDGSLGRPPPPACATTIYELQCVMESRIDALRDAIKETVYLVQRSALASEKRLEALEQTLGRAMGTADEAFSSSAPATDRQARSSFDQSAGTGAGAPAPAITPERMAKYRMEADRIRAELAAAPSESERPQPSPRPPLPAPQLSQIDDRTIARSPSVVARVRQLERQASSYDAQRAFVLAAEDQEAQLEGQLVRAEQVRLVPNAEDDEGGQPLIRAEPADDQHSTSWTRL